MSNLTSAINVQVDSETKKKATDILNELGLSMSSAINIFLKQVIKKDGIPFEITNSKSNKELIEHLREVEDMKKNPDKYPSYNNWEELEKSLLSDD